MEKLHSVAKELVDLKMQHKDFKKTKEEVFKEHRQYNKAIKTKTHELMELLKEADMDHYDCDGTHFQLTTHTTEKHDMEALAELLDNEEAFNTYRSAVQLSKPRISTKRKRTGEE